MKKMNKKGFTLAELLIIVAIIAVLVAIAIPVFTSQLKKAENATDLANVRAEYADVVATALADGQMTASGKMAVTIHNSTATHGTVTQASGKVIVTHSKDSTIKGSFKMDDDISLTIS